MPKTFSFNLDPVLRYRGHLEQQKRRELAGASRAVLEMNRELVRLIQDETKGKEQLREMKSAGNLELGRIRLQEQYLNGLDRGIRAGYVRLRDLMRAEKEARAALVEARKQVRVLERLKDRRRADYLYAVARAEQKETDEVGVTRYRAGGSDVS